jgi:nucleoredoxin
MAIAKLLGETLTGQGATTVATSTLEGKTVLLYFSAHWCPPCREFTPKLVAFHEKHKATKNFEVLFASWDNDEKSFSEYYAKEHGEWPAFPFESRQLVENLQNEHNIQTIPTLLVMGPSGKLVTRYGREMVEEDPEALKFPWKGLGLPKAVVLESRQRRTTQAALVLSFFVALYITTIPRPQQWNHPLGGKPVDAAM